MGTSVVEEVVEEFRSGAGPERLQSIPVPTSFLASFVRTEDQSIFGDEEARDPSKTLRTGPIETPEIAPDEVLVVVMASSVNYNTAWTATFLPIPTFVFLERYGRAGPWPKRHDQPYHIPGSDAAGFILRKGSLVDRWNVGDQVVISATYVDGTSPEAQGDAIASDAQLAWGYETNFGGLAQLTIAKASQLLPRARHLTWEESAATSACGAAVYRCLVGDNGARIKQGDAVLVWGAAGGMGSYATQLVSNGGGIPIGVVSSASRAAVVKRSGCDRVIDRTVFPLPLAPNGLPGDAEVKSFGKEIRRLVGKDPEVVFEHPGRDTMGTSVFVAARDGRIVTNGATSGPVVAFDNRHLWMRVKAVVGSHNANASECRAFNDLVLRGMVVPTVSRSITLSELAVAAADVSNGAVVGKVAVRCCCHPGEGVEDHNFREQVGEERINAFRPT